MSKVKTIDGLPIINAKRSVKICVTKAEIDSADRKAPDQCVMARACRHEMHVQEARVHLGRVYVRTQSGKHWQRFITSAPLRTEIIAFDKGGEFAPGEYTLSAPNPAKRATGKQQGGKNRFSSARKNPNRKKRRAPHVVQNVRGGPAV